MEFGVGMGRNERIDEIGELAQVAEESGFSHLSFIDSQNLSRDVYVMMTIAALTTRRIRIGHGVTNPITRHPSVTANATATINELSGGRAFLGIGVGMSAVMTMGEGPRPQRERLEAIGFIRKYMAGEEAEFKGARMHSEWIRRPVPIYMAANGPRALQLAGGLGDGVIITGVHPELIRWKMELIEKGALKAGRDPSKVDVWVRTMCYVADSKKAAHREVASYAATGAFGIYTGSFGRDSPETANLCERVEQTEPGLIDEFKVVAEAYEAYQHERTDAPHGKLVTQRVIDATMLTGTPEDISEQIYGLQQVGVRTISVVTYTIIDKKGMMREIGNRVIPLFRN